MTSIGIDHVCTPRTGSVYDLTEFWKLGILFFLRATVDSRCQNGSHPFCLEFSLIFFMTGWAIALLETEKIKHFFLSSFSIVTRSFNHLLRWTGVFFLLEKSRPTQYQIVQYIVEGADYQ